VEAQAKFVVKVHGRGAPCCGNQREGWRTFPKPCAGAPAMAEFIMAGCDLHDSTTR
jgi:hypothetical protein